MLSPNRPLDARNAEFSAGSRAVLPGAPILRPGRGCAGREAPARDRAGGRPGRAADRLRGTAIAAIGATNIPAGRRLPRPHAGVAVAPSPLLRCRAALPSSPRLSRHAGGFPPRRQFSRPRRRSSCMPAAACRPATRFPALQATFPPGPPTFPARAIESPAGAIESPAPRSSEMSSPEDGAASYRHAARRFVGLAPARAGLSGARCGSAYPHRAGRVPRPGATRRRRALVRPSSFAQRMARSMLLPRAVASRPTGARDPLQSFAGNQSAAGCRGRR